MRLLLSIEYINFTNEIIRKPMSFVISNHRVTIELEIYYAFQNRTKFTELRNMFEYPVERLHTACTRTINKCATVWMAQVENVPCEKEMHGLCLLCVEWIKTTLSLSV